MLTPFSEIALCSYLRFCLLSADPLFSILTPRSLSEKVWGIFMIKLSILITAIPKDKIYLIAIEHIHTLDFDERLEAFIKIKDKKFGKTTMSYFKNEGIVNSQSQEP